MEKINDKTLLLETGPRIEIKKQPPFGDCFYGAGDEARLHLRSAQIMDRLGQALAGNSMPD